MSDLNVKKLMISSAIGTGIGAICSSVMLFLMAAILAIGNIPPALILPMAMATLAIGAFASGIIAAKLGKSKGIICGAVSGIIFFVLVWIRSAIVGSTFGIELIIKAVIIILSSALGGIIGINK